MLVFALWRQSHGNFTACSDDESEPLLENFLAGSGPLKTCLKEVFQIRSRSSLVVALSP